MNDFITHCIQKALEEFDARGALFKGETGYMQGTCSITTNGDLLFPGCTFPHTVEVVLFGLFMIFDTETWEASCVSPVGHLPDYMQEMYAEIL